MEGLELCLIGRLNLLNRIDPVLGKPWQTHKAFDSYDFHFAKMFRESQSEMYKKVNPSDDNIGCTNVECGLSKHFGLKNFLDVFQDKYKVLVISRGIKMKE